MADVKKTCPIAPTREDGMPRRAVCVVDRHGVRDSENCESRDTAIVYVMLTKYLFYSMLFDITNIVRTTSS